MLTWSNLNAHRTAALLACLALLSSCEESAQVTREDLVAACVAASAEFDAIRQCSAPTECGQVLPHCSGAATPVVRLDANADAFLEMQRRVTKMYDQWTEPLPAECLVRGLVPGGTCDCVGAVTCAANRCERECP